MMEDLYFTLLSNHTGIEKNYMMLGKDTQMIRPCEAIDAMDELLRYLSEWLDFSDKNKIEVIRHTDGNYFCYVNDSLSASGIGETFREAFFNGIKNHIKK